MGTFAQRLTQLRERHDLKKSELASIINVSPACVSQYERGDSMPGYDILCLLSQYFGVSTDYLLGNKTNDFCYQLDDCYCNDMSYHDLLLLCSSVPREHREILLRIIAAFKVNTE